MTLLGVGSFLRIRNEITRGISGGGPKKPSGISQMWAWLRDRGGGHAQTWA